MLVRRSGLAVAAAMLLMSAGSTLLVSAGSMLLVSAGCKSPQPRVVDVGRSGAGTLRLVVAPMNLPVQLSPDLEDAVEPVTQELIRYLQAHDGQVSVIFGPDAWALWRDSEDALREGREEPPDLAAVASVFARSLAKESDFDLLVLPSLVFRDARVTGRFAQWDGVRRRIRFRVRSAVPSERAQSLPDPVRATDLSGAGFVPPEFRGQITGLSLHTLVFTPDGLGVFQGFGGLDLVHDTVQKRDGSEDRSLRLHSRLLEDAEHVREGIALALDPYLVESRSR